MGRAHSRLQVAGHGSRVEASAPILLLPSVKDLSRHPQGKSDKAGRRPAPSLDPLKHNCNEAPLKCSCGRWTLRGEQEAGGAKYVRLGCKGWTCPRCGPKKAKRVRNGIIQQATKQDLRRFLTLTLDPRHCTPEESIAYIREVWRKFRVSLQRRLGESVTFIAVIELHKSGYAHLHILISDYLPQSWVSEAWNAVGGGKIVFVKYADIHRVSAYVSKYLTKELLLAHGKAKYRRYTTSRNIKLFEKTASEKWTLVKMPIYSLARFFGPRITQENWAKDGILEDFLILSPPTNREISAN